MFARNKKTMNRNIILSLLSLLLLTVSCGDGKEEFVIKGKLNNLGGQPLYAVYEESNAIVVDTLNPEDGKIEMQGEALELTPVQLYNYSWRPFMRLYMRNGERVEIEGDANLKYEIKMKGSRLNRDLWKLICQNNEIFSEAYNAGYDRDRGVANDDRYNTAIARLDSLLLDFIDHNHSNKLSSVLIGDYLLRYDNFRLCDSLWNTLDQEAQLPFIASTIERLRNELSFDKDNSRLPHLRYLNDSDTLHLVKTRDSKATLLCFWTTDDNRQAYSYRRELMRYAQEYDKEKLQVVALSFDRDTASWHRVIKNDTTHIVDLWGDAIYTSKLLKNYNVTRMPVYMLADSLGNILVRTMSLPDTDIDAQLDSLLTHPQYSIEQPIFKP